MHRLFYLLLTLIIFSCVKEKRIFTNDNLELIYSDNFDGDSLFNWRIESQTNMPNEVEQANGVLNINVTKGLTLWFESKLEGNILIEYDAKVISKGGPNDRVSDLNCFWMARDLRNENDIFNSGRNESGKFHDYDTLQLYYVGMGGHNNTKTRFRRYTGYGEKPLLPHHDLSGKESLIEANKIVSIQLVVYNSRVMFICNDKIIYDYMDSNVYTNGWFGFRTINNHMQIDNFKIYKIK